MSHRSATLSPGSAEPLPEVRTGPGLTIGVAAGTGEGATPLSAFDAALFQCGAHNYNLIPLSSVIPSASTVEATAFDGSSPTQLGARLFVVMARAGSATRGTTVAAGLGWSQWDDGRGVFVEHTLSLPGAAEPAIERQLTELILASLRDLAARRGVPFSQQRTGTRLATVQVREQPACAVVLARYQAEPWDRRPGAGMEDW